MVGRYILLAVLNSESAYNWFVKPGDCHSFDMHMEC